MPPRTPEVAGNAAGGDNRAGEDAWGGGDGRPGGDKPRRSPGWLWRTVLAATIGFHFWLCAMLCGGRQGLATPWPLVTHDHPLHYASAVMTREFLAASGTNAGYDPSFMAGYAKSSIWPTNPLLELVMFFLGGLGTAQVYKWFVVLVGAALPVFVAAAARLWRFDETTATVAAVLFVLTFWTDWGFHFLEFGMTAFVASVGLVLLLAATLTRFLDAPTCRWSLALGLVGGLTLMSHPTTVVLCLPPALAASALSGRMAQQRFWKWTLAAVAVCLALNYWWLVPLVTLRGTWGRGPEFFVNPNLGERLAELVRGQWVGELVWAPVVSTLLSLGVAIALVSFAASRGWRLDRAQRIRALVMALFVGWLFALAFPAGTIASLAFLQLGRNSFHFQVWACIVTAAVLVEECRWPSRWAPVLVAAVCLWTAATAVPGMGQIVRDVGLGAQRNRLAEPSPNQELFLIRAGEFIPAGSGVFFETFEDSSPLLADAANPFGSIRLSPLVPGATGWSLIGGPYLRTHYQANFAQIGDGWFLQSLRWDRDRVVAHATIYGVDYAVIWSPPALEFCARHPDVATLLTKLGGFSIFRIHRPPAPWEKLGITVKARRNEIVVTAPLGVSGRVALPFHWTPGLYTDIDHPIEAVTLGDDPVPFIAIVDPPERMAIRFSPWRR